MFEWFEGGVGAGQPVALRLLAEVCGTEYARPAGATDHVAGAPARWVAAPGDADEVARVLGIAGEHGLTVAVCGSGTKLDWGRPPTAVDLLIDTVRLRGVDGSPLPGVDGGPAGSTTTVGAGASMRFVRAALAQIGQRFPLEVGSPGATLGGVLGADESGPMRLTYGTARDLVVGLEFVTADAVVSTGMIGIDGFRAADGADGVSGGRSDPRVAGSTTEPALALGELAPMLIGACGTLGVITRATIRIFPQPTARAWVVRSVRSPLEARELAGSLLASPLMPVAVEVDLPVGHGWLAALFEGPPDHVTMLARAGVGLLGGDAAEQPEPPAWWGRYPFTQHSIALRLTAATDDLYSVVYALRDAALDAVAVRGSLSAGVAFAALPGRMPPGRVRQVLAAARSTLLARGGACTLLRAPDAVRALTDDDNLASVAGLAKAWLDPYRRFAPGRMPCVP